MSDFSKTQTTRKTLKCPICARPVPIDDPNMPFCSDRCRGVDLGNWATEKYAIPTTNGQYNIEDELNKDSE